MRGVSIAIANMILSQWITAFLICPAVAVNSGNGWSLPRSFSQNRPLRGGGGAEDPEINEKLQELQKKWSSVPANPSITYPKNKNSQQTLGDLHENNEKTKAIIIMDGFCPYHGQYLSFAAREYFGAASIQVSSNFVTRYLYEVEGERDHLSSRLPNLESEQDVRGWMDQISDVEICGIYCESDSGLEDAERLGEVLGLQWCHDGVNPARRDKFLMNEVVANAGLDTVKQKLCRSLEEAEAFSKGLGVVVVKPIRGVASDDVYLCDDLTSLREAFGKIHQSPLFGSAVEAKNEHVLVQEFATGVEYAIDVVCRDGERKVAALWKYDKRAVNGAPFVYHATELVSAENEVEKEVCHYVFQVLEALGIRWGLSHVEVIADSDEGKVRVRLVEVNCRQHNTDFMPLTDACIGYNALDMVLESYLGTKQNWDSIPILPTIRAHGAIVHFVSHVKGTLSNIRYDTFQNMEELKSVVDMHIYPQFLDIGNSIEKTVDIRSDTGWAHIINKDEGEFRRDYDRLVEFMKVMFEVEEGD